MPTRSDIRDLVRVQTLVESDDLTDAKVNNLIDQAIRDISVRFNWPYLATTGQIAVTAGTATYALPADADRVQAVLLEGVGKPLWEVDSSTALAAEGAVVGTGTPNSFFIWGESIVLRPSPTSAETLTLYYFRTPTVLTNDSQEPEFASQFHYVIADFVMQQLWEREEDFEKGSVYASRYGQGVESMARYYLNRVNDSPLTLGEPAARRRQGPRQPWLEI